MRAAGRVHWRLLVAGFRRQSTYRLAALGGLVANTTFGFLKVAILFAAARCVDWLRPDYPAELARRVPADTAYPRVDLGSQVSGAPAVQTIPQTTAQR